MCLIQLSVATRGFYSYFSKKSLQLPLVAESLQEKLAVKTSGFSLQSGAGLYNKFEVQRYIQYSNNPTILKSNHLKK